MCILELEGVKLEVELMLITPEHAQKFLDSRPPVTPNRNIRPYRVEQYERDMKAGRWRVNGEPIRFDVNGQMVNGSHRCTAAVKGGCSFPSLVIWGLPVDAFADIDTNAPRTLGDVLKYEGVSDATNAAALTGLLFQWDNGTIASHRNRGPTREEAREKYHQHASEVTDALPWGQRVGRHLGGVRSQWALLRLLTARIDMEDSDFFFERLLDGQGLSKGNPIYALREWHIKNMNEKAFHYRQLVDQLARGIKAWNAYRAGAQLIQLKWVRGGAKPEAMPVPV